MNEPRFTHLHEHPRELRYGLARIIFSDGYGLRNPPAYRLPGGSSTESRAEAEAVAIEMDRMLREGRAVTL